MFTEVNNILALIKTYCSYKQSISNNFNLDKSAATKFLDKFSVNLYTFLVFSLNKKTQLI